MLIEAVTVSVGYGDLLAVVAPHNRPHLARWVIVTDPADQETQAVCKRLGLECVLSEDHGRGGEFAKARMIQRGLAMLGGKDWLLHLDADVALPNDLAPVLADAHLDERCIYGCDRLNVVGPAEWEAASRGGLYCRQNPWAVHVSRQVGSVGTRVANLGHGYTPIGFFQLWHGSSGFGYPIHHGTAARTDVQHALQWDRRHRVLIPELLVWHVETERARMGTNWRGRRTKRAEGYC